MPRVLLSALIACGCCRFALGIVVTGTYVAERHDRFENNSQFIGAVDGIDFSGVGRTTGGTWITMISADSFLTAGHTTPTVGSQALFHFSNSSTGPTATCNIASSQQIGNGAGLDPTDLRLGRLDLSSCTFTGTSTNTLTSYEIASFNSSSPTQYDGSTVHQVGISSGSTTSPSFRVAKNILSVSTQDEVLDIDPLGNRRGDWGYYADDSAAGDANTVPNGATASLIADESYYQGGDSGGPSFLVTNAGPLLIGIHSWTNGRVTAGGDTHRASGDVFLPGYKSQLSALTAVPEPSQWLLMLLMLSGFLGWRWSGLGVASLR